MEQYISKSTLVAEINKVLNSYDPNEITSGRYALVDLRNFIDTLEVKEINFGDKDEWKNTGGFGSTWDPDSPDYCPD